MRNLSSIRRFLNDEHATTAVEYAVMLAMILVVIILGVTSFGGGAAGWWSNIDTDLKSHGF